MKGLDCLNKDSIKLLSDHQMLEHLIKSQLTKNILKEVHIDKDIENQLVDKFKKSYQLTDTEKYNKFLVDNNVSDQDVIDLCVKADKLKIHSKKTYAHQVEARFLERKNNLDVFVYSLIRIKDVFTAKEIYMRLLHKEETFEDLAEQHSEGPEKITRGIVGPASIESAHPILAKALRMSPIGEIQPPIQIPGQAGEITFVIIRLNYHEPAKLDEYMREKMSLEIFNKFLDEEVNKYLVELMPSFSAVIPKAWEKYS